MVRDRIKFESGTRSRGILPGRSQKSNGFGAKPRRDYTMLCNVRPLKIGKPSGPRSLDALQGPDQYGDLVEEDSTKIEQHTSFGYSANDRRGGCPKQTLNFLG